ncbi:MAG: DeoR family transcriptional regulator, partial [Spirochaetales bacterium]|nr:DeoR family transcriptional regulator [Spirochaetales bacterium]
MDSSYICILHDYGTAFGICSISYRIAYLVIIMQELLDLLKDGRTRTVEMLAEELNTTVEDVRRKLEYLENVGILTNVCSLVDSRCSGG